MGMMEEVRVHRTIEKLLSDREKGAPFDKTYDKDLVPRSMPEAYRVQDSLIRRFGSKGIETGGWRIALTTGESQDKWNANHPMVGPLWKRDISHSPDGLPAVSRHVPRAGPEIAFRIASPMSAEDGPWEERDAVLERIDAAMLAIGVEDDRGASILPFHSIGLAVADLACVSGCVLGEEIEGWREIDLAALDVETSLDERVLGSVSTSALLAHPIEIVGWVAKHLNVRRRKLEAGDVVLTGCFGEPVSLGFGDMLTAKAEGAGQVSLRFSS